MVLASEGGVRVWAWPSRGAWPSRSRAQQAWVKGRGLTRDVDLIRSRSTDFQLQAPAALRVVHAAQRGHAAHTAPVHVHLAAWGEGGGGTKLGVVLQASPPTPDSIPRHFPALWKGPRSHKFRLEQTHRSISCPGAPARTGGSRSGRRRSGCCSCADGTCVCSGGPGGTEEAVREGGWGV